MKITTSSWRVYIRRSHLEVKIWVKIPIFSRAAVKIHSQFLQIFSNSAIQQPLNRKILLSLLSVSPSTLLMRERNLFE